MTHFQPVFCLICVGLVSSETSAGTKICSAPIDASASVGYPSRVSVSIDEDAGNKACYFIVDGVHPGEMIQAFFNEDAGTIGNAIADEFDALPGDEPTDAYRTDGFSASTFECYSAAFEMRNDAEFLHINEEFDVASEEYDVNCYLLAGAESSDLGEFDEALSGFGSIAYQGPEIAFVRQKQYTEGRQIVFLPIFEETE